jgi:hypothetical protein
MKLPLLDTDQIHCYAQDGGRIACDGTGQDASSGKRVARSAGDRFRVLEDVVEDMLTGAVWTRDANPAEFPMTWHEARRFVARMCAQRRHGYDNWQLPSRRLLFSLISHQRCNPAVVEGHVFARIFNGYYWTGQPCFRLPDQAWYIHLGGGRIHRGMRHGSYLVWPVSIQAGGASDSRPSAPHRFTPEDGCVHDSRTGLTWLGEADLTGCKLTWTAALRAVGDLNVIAKGGFRNWRLPNIRELESLVDTGSHSPALAADHPFSSVRDAYWSSTTSVYEPRYAWTLYSRDGIVGVGFKAHEEFYAWPVRKG